MVNGKTGTSCSTLEFQKFKPLFEYSYTAKVELKKKSKHPQDNRLSKREFRQFVTLVADAMPGADSFEYFIEFLNNSVEVSMFFVIIFSSPIQSTGRAIVVTLASAFALALALTLPLPLPFPSRHF